jgi:inorganic pyrophosphatase
MGLSLVPTGRDVPNEINVIIEIPKDAEPVKYEVDKETGAIFVDRILSTPMRYPCNYGYVPHTLCGDGDPVDVLVILPLTLVPGSVIRCRPVGMLKMTDEAGEDTKLVAVPGPRCSRATSTSPTSRRSPATGWSASATSSSTTRISRRASG